MADEPDPTNTICICWPTWAIEFPMPGSQVVYCSVCIGACWRNDGAPEYARTVCWECTRHLPDDEFVVMVSPEQVAKAKADGWDDEQIEEMRSTYEMFLRKFQ